MSIEDVRQFVREWNAQYPIDKWYRSKYRIGFGTTEHFNLCMMDMRIEFEEHELFSELLKQLPSKKDYVPGTGNWLNAQQVQPMDIEQIDTLDDINLDDFSKGIVTVPNK